MPITYTDKDNAQPTSDPRRIFTAANANEIKSVVNSVETTANSASSAVALRPLSSSFKYNITPTGTVNGSNLVFTLPDIPSAGTLCLYADTLRMKLTTDFTLAGAVITFVAAPTQWVLADYRI